MSEYYKKIGNHDVWVTVTKPVIPDTNTGGYVEADQYCTAFKFGEQPKIIDGEYLRDDSGNIAWFSDADTAATAAFAAAEEKIKNAPE